MPTSDYHQISDVLHVVQQVDPKTVLDVGVGFGKWGILCREILEVYNSRVSPESWKLRIDGIEIHEPYRNQLWDFAYNQVHIGDAVTIIDEVGTYDLILCCDVIEHFEKSAGLEFIENLLLHGKMLIITSPRGFVQQGAIYDNEFERHRSGWGHADFRPFPHLYKEIGFTFMAVLGADSSRLRRIDVMHPLRVLGVKKGARELSKLVACRIRERLS
jgi:SAM-dependent methyltransferase